MPAKKRSLSTIFEKYCGHPEFLGLVVTDPNQRGAVDDTLLHLAARLGALDDIKDLVALGANVNAIGDLGNTPLHQAAMRGQAESIKLLLKLRARTDIKNEFGETPIDVAMIGGHNHLIRLFKK